MAVKWVAIVGSKYYPFTKEVWDGLKPDDQLESIAKGVALLQLNMKQMPWDWGIVVTDDRGPAAWAIEYAEEQSRECVVYPVDRRLGSGAKTHRYKLMANHVDSGLVFWDGESRYTNQFIRIMYKMEKELFIVGPTGTPWAIFDRGYYEDNGEYPADPS